MGGEKFLLHIYSATPPPPPPPPPTPAVWKCEQELISKSRHSVLLFHKALWWTERAAATLLMRRIIAFFIFCRVEQQKWTWFHKSSESFQVATATSQISVWTADEKDPSLHDGSEFTICLSRHQLLWRADVFVVVSHTFSHCLCHLANLMWKATENIKASHWKYLDLLIWEEAPPAPLTKFDPSLGPDPFRIFL